MHLAEVVRESSLEEVALQVTLEESFGELRKEHCYVQGVAGRLALTWPSWEGKLEREVGTAYEGS